MPAELEQEVAVLLQQLQEHCCRDGAWVENKGVLLTFHYRNVAKDKREPLVARSPCPDNPPSHSHRRPRARELILGAGFQIGSAHCALESKPRVAWDKGRASIYILRSGPGRRDVLHHIL